MALNEGKDVNVNLRLALSLSKNVAFYKIL